MTLDLAKGTLYKHFASKDELLLRILIDYEKRKLDMIIVEDGAGTGVARLVIQLVNLPHVRFYLIIFKNAFLQQPLD